MAPAEYNPLRPGQTLKEETYTVVRRLGQGGMGAVYLATEEIAHRERYVVVKEMLDYYDSTDPAEAAEARRDFEKEAATLVGLSHPGIPRIDAYFTDQGRNYIVMEYIAGKDLSQGLSYQREQDGWVQGQPYPVEQVVEWGIALCKVLEYLKRQNPPVVHHDIKPENIILDANAGEPRLVDFGIAKARLVEQPGGRVGVGRTRLHGTKGYAAPEMFDGKSSPRSDVYALAATLYHLLTDDHPGQYVFKFPMLYTLPPELAHLLSQALSLDVKKRPEVKKFRERLEEIAAPPPVVPPFTFQNGEQAHTPEELATLSDKHWDQARAYLYDGRYAKWFAELNRNDLLVHLETAIDREPNRDIGLEKFLHSLNADRRPPYLAPRARRIRFGLCDPETETRPQTRLRIYNDGRGCLYGTCQADVPWLHVPQPHFALTSGRGVDLIVEVRTDQLAYGKRYRGHLRIDSNAGQARIQVGLDTPAPWLRRQGLIRLLGFEGGFAGIAWGILLGAPLWVFAWLLNHGALFYLASLTEEVELDWSELREYLTILGVWNVLVGVVVGAVVMARTKSEETDKPEPPVQAERARVKPIILRASVINALLVVVYEFVDDVLTGGSTGLGSLLCKSIVIPFMVVIEVAGGLASGYIWIWLWVGIRSIIWKVVNLVYPVQDRETQ